MSQLLGQCDECAGKGVVTVILEGDVGGTVPCQYCGATGLAPLKPGGPGLRGSTQATILNTLFFAPGLAKIRKKLSMLDMDAIARHVSVALRDAPAVQQESGEDG
jgi:hypothetical protein